MANNHSYGSGMPYHEGEQEEEQPLGAVGGDFDTPAALLGTSLTNDLNEMVRELLTEGYSENDFSVVDPNNFDFDLVVSNYWGNNNDNSLDELMNNTTFFDEAGAPSLTQDPYPQGYPNYEHPSDQLNYNSLPEPEGGSMGLGCAPSVYGPPVPGSGPPETHRRPKTRKKQAARTVDSAANSPTAIANYDQTYPDLSAFGILSPSSSSSSDEGTQMTQRQRRPRVSHSSLTDEQRYNRVRQQNNEASKVYRQKRKATLVALQNKISQELERNRGLRDREAAILRMKAKVQQKLNELFGSDMDGYLS